MLQKINLSGAEPARVAGLIDAVVKNSAIAAASEVQDDPPTFIAAKTRHVMRMPRAGRICVVVQAVFQCPKCGKTNHHGVGHGDDDIPQHRVAHCGCWPHGYFLKLV